jgi:mannose-6-phosphate isomerase-like protein (cupin superfamily)
VAVPVTRPAAAPLTTRSGRRDSLAHPGRVRPGASPASSAHRQPCSAAFFRAQVWVEFRVVRGRVQVLVGEDTVTADAGQEVIVPAGTAHSFRALEAGTQLRLRVTPGHGFEAALEDVFELLDQGQLGPDGPVDLAVWNACFERHKQVMVSARNRPADPGPRSAAA